MELHVPPFHGDGFIVGKGSCGPNFVWVEPSYLALGQITGLVSLWSSWALW